jgi:hypothetical protein
VYARFVAIIYELVKHKVTRERIEAINFHVFSNMYSDIFKMIGGRWFGIYPLYENAVIHVKQYNHCCTANCPVFKYGSTVTSCTPSELADMSKIVEYHFDFYEHPDPKQITYGANPAPRFGRPNERTNGPRRYVNHGDGNAHRSPYIYPSVARPMPSATDFPLMPITIPM